MQHHLFELRKAMKEHGNIDAYLIPSSDYHGSEYIGDHFAGRAYISGFTGSAGVLLVMQDWAGLWTDGRYFLQAEAELAGSGITLMKQGLTDTPSIESILTENLSSGQCFAFDGRCVSSKDGKRFEKALSPLGISLQIDCDLLDHVWSDRPALSAEPVWPLDLSYAGQSRREKISVVRNIMSKNKADYLLITSLEEIAWLLNLRGGDIPCTPVFLSYLMLSQTDVFLYINPSIVSEKIRTNLQNDGITLCSYQSVYDAVSALPMQSTVWMNTNANFLLYQNLPSKIKQIRKASPIQHLKSIKNEAEIKNIKIAHLKDGIALTKFMYWLKHSQFDGSITELSATDIIESLRKEQPDYIGPSFAPIVAYNAHGAIVHYSATNDTNCPLYNDGFLLVDTGGHYINGTTDCTRTFALGTLTPKQKQHYTAVLCGNLNLDDAKFLHGCTGANLDYLARNPLWDLQLDYRHGTGHGVSYLLSVHEGPQQISYRGTGQNTPLEVGMITSNEPGVYFPNKYGIRLENLILCIKTSENEYGEFLAFQTLTMTPFDLDAINASQMNDKQIELLNEYHALVFETISPHLTQEEQTWLRFATRPLPLSSKK